MNETAKKVIVSGIVLATAAVGYLAQPGGEGSLDLSALDVQPVPAWKVEVPIVAPLAGGHASLSIDPLPRPSETAPALAAAPTMQDITLAAPAAASVDDGGGEQQAARDGALKPAAAQIAPPPAPAWLDGWYWPAWRGAAPATPGGRWPVVTYPAAPPTTPHLVAVAANATTPMTPLAEYLAGDAQAAAVIVGWEETDHSYRANATLDAARAEAVAKTVRAARPGLPVWLLCSATVTGSPEQAAAKVAAAQPDALVVYGLFAPPAWSEAMAKRNLDKARALAPGKPVYAAGQRFTDAAVAARARALGWKGFLWEGLPGQP